MKTLVIGSGAREHALVQALLRDESVTEVVCAPGNAGIADDVPVLPVDVADPEAIAELAAAQRADFVVIGPEVPLVAGAADALAARGITAFGPTAAAAQLEGSKSFAKDVMAAAGVPTAASRTCTDLPAAEAALDEFGPTYVVKDDGLAAGKGVVVTDSRDEALAHARACFEAGGQVVVEEFLDGPEVSLFCITDGQYVVPLQPAQDFKRVGDGDTGPNTGGMGAYTPLPWAPAELVDDVLRDVAQPTIKEMARRGTPFAGVLYVGLALTSRGLRVVEFNARFGDPETQSVLAMLQTPLGALLHAAATGRLAEQPPLQWRDGASVTVVLAASGYPASPRTGDPIVVRGEPVPDVAILHAGTRRDGARVVSAGGRVLSVVAVADDLLRARAAAYAQIARIELAGSHYRRDIAQRAIG
ncbi:phosphoribosylamine--glycine ligase [Epidermidibacterium keratini]|uniref:Phosphoribosylamine--glycine ligase n=1 Tax=Epidermidibacterium keratini TaxID=1891644 RepID=A0A7L4YL87_9ACTN|nr:phosphoribosylamine--glycine ligase [Epidermidibacterium keratini]QHC00045.1 phosphoribosylamine--glycine ligase [Epidermidibacterium keratini]